MRFLDKFRRVRISEERPPNKRIEEALEALRRVEVPGYDTDVVTSGVVTRVRVSYDGRKIAVFLDYSGSNPGCSFCRFLNDNLWRKILVSAVNELRREGFEVIYLLDSATGRPITVI